MSNIIKYYKYFLEKKENGANKFLEECFNYDFNNYKFDLEELFDIYLDKKYDEFTDNFLMMSNGSSGNQVSYLFGPDKGVVNLLETMMRKNMSSDENFGLFIKIDLFKYFPFVF